MPLTKEQLLQKRYKVIAQYPYSPHANGEIIYARQANKYFDKYPHLFQHLQWWQDRQDDEMPVYVKHNKTGEVYHVTEWDINVFYVKDGKAISNVTQPDLFDYIGAAIVTPIDEEEYTAYINQKQQ